MSEARQKVQWDHTVAIVAKVHNVNCTKNRDRIKNPNSIHPMRGENTKTVKGSIDQLADLMGA